MIGVTSMRRYSFAMRATAWTIMTTMARLAVLDAPARCQQLAARQVHPKPVSELPPGLTQMLTPEQSKMVEEKERAASKPLDVRPLDAKEMQQYRGSGNYRSKYFNGTL